MLRACLLLALVSVLAACGPAADPCARSGSYSLGHAPTLTVADDAAHVWSDGASWIATLGTHLHLDLRNAGQGVDGAPLRITAIEVDGPLTCALADGKPCVGATATLLGTGGVAACLGPGGLDHLALDLTSGGPATLRVKTTDPMSTWTLQIAQTAGRGQLECPGMLALAEAASGTTASVTCHNVGDGPLQVTGAKLAGTYAKQFAVTLAGRSIAEPWPEPLLLAPGQSLDVDATLTLLPEPHKTTAYLQILSDDPQHPQVEVALVATRPGDCLLLKPTVIEFGAVAVGLKAEKALQLQNCSSLDLHLTDVQVVGAAELTVPWPGADPVPTPQKPVTIPAGQALSLTIACTPAHPGTVTGTLQITSEGGELQVPLQCGSTAAACPTPCLAPLGAQLPVHQPIALDSTCSQASPGHVLQGRTWTVTGPQGAQAQVFPSATATKASVTPHAVGPWTVQLDVTDDAGTPGCAPAVTQVQVLPDDALHADLTWEQPGMPAGAPPPSVELHLAELSTGAQLPDTTKDGEPDPWFQPCLDVWKVNAQPNWGAQDSDLDDPVFAQGSAGSSIGLYAPAPGLYVFAAYVWTDQKHGPVTPHVLLHAKGLTDVEVTGPPLVSGDLWCIQRIQWSQAGLPQWSPCPGQALAHKFPPPSPSQSFGCN